MLKRCGLTVVLLLTLLAHGAAAYGASTPASPGDPPTGSPSGAIYQLPFEKGRADAAPKGGGGTSAPGESGAAGGGSGAGGASGGGGEGEASLYRSENNFGSSSRVPGNPSAADNAGGGGGSETGSAGAGGGNGAGAIITGAAAGAAHATDSGNTSPAANIALLCVIGLIAGGVGIFAVRANRLRAQQ